MLLCKILLTFQRIMVLPTSDSSILWWHDHEKEVTMALWNNRKYSLNDSVTPHRTSVFINTSVKNSNLAQNMLWNLRVPIFGWKVAEATNELGLIKIYSVTGLFTAQQQEHTHLLSSCPLYIEKPRTASSSFGCTVGLSFAGTSRRDCSASCFFSLQQP